MNQQSLRAHFGLRSGTGEGHVFLRSVVNTNCLLSPIVIAGVFECTKAIGSEKQRLEHFARVLWRTAEIIAPWRTQLTATNQLRWVLRDWMVGVKGTCWDLSLDSWWPWSPLAAPCRISMAISSSLARSGGFGSASPLPRWENLPRGIRPAQRN